MTGSSTVRREDPAAPPEACRLFEQQAQATPGATAVEQAGQSLSYSELNLRAQRLALLLSQADVGPDSRVGLLLDRGIGQAVAVLGILKAGAAYIPLDPQWPEARLRQVLQDLEPKLVVSGRHWTKQLGNHAYLCLDALAEQTIPIGPWPAPGRLAYLICTSGSTGRPKGVCVSREALGNHCAAVADAYELSASDRVLQFASICFDVAAEELFPTWSRGGTVVLREEGALDSFAVFEEFVRARALTVLNLPGSFWQRWVGELERTGRSFPETVRLVVAGNEPISRAAYETWRRVTGDTVAWFNAYGPTETTITATLFRGQGPLPTSDLATVPIGYPIRGARVYILDADGGRLAGGEAGEICIGGQGLAEGYFRQPLLTAERFLPDPFLPGERIYRTGDLGRVGAGGELEFLGRMDDQLKVRGHRVEPGEVASVLNDHPRVEESVVVGCGDKAGETRLTAYVARRPSAIELWPCPGDYQVFDEVMYHAMTRDWARNARYGAAFQRLVAERVTLDIGTGRDALLARMMVEAGARRVYALEANEAAAAQAEATVRRLGLQDRIEVIRGDADHVELPELVEVCASELIGNIGNAEGAASILNRARRFLQPGGVMIPERCVTWVAAVTLPEEIIAAPAFTHLSANYAAQVYQLAGGPFDLRVCVRNLSEDCLLSDSALFEELDFRGVIEPEFDRPVLLSVQRPGRMHGFLLWIHLSPAAEEQIDTLSGHYSWLPVFFPVFPEGIDVLPGDQILAHASARIQSDPRRPDYRLRGVVRSARAEERAFDFFTPLFGGPRGQNEFYRHLLSAPSVEPDPELSASELRRFLKTRLPDYMVPGRFIMVDRLPRLSGGKIDRNALPARPAAEGMGSRARPMTPTEEILAEIWREVLEVDEVELDADFFELGGHSLHATQVGSRVRELFGVDLPLVVLFEAPTPRALGARIDSIAASTQGVSLPEIRQASHQEPGQGKEGLPLSFAQERLWFLDQLAPGQSSYNMPEALRLHGAWDAALLERALNEVVRRHEVLRTCYRQEADGPRQYPFNPTGSLIRQVDLREVPEPDRAKRWRREAEIEARQPFDLGTGPILRATLWRLADGERLLLLCLHHIAADAWSMGVLYNELMEIYRALEHGKTPRLPDLPIQYGDFALWQKQWLTDEALRGHLDYWTERLAGCPSLLRLPSDYPRPPRPSGQGGVISAVVPEAIASGLARLCRRERVTLFMTLLAGFQTLLHRCSGQTDIVVGSPVAGRTRKETEPLIGCFVNTLVFRARFEGNPTALEILTQVRQRAIEAIAHQELPFERLVHHLRPARDPSHTPLFQVMFALHNTPAFTWDAGASRAEPERIETGTALFDLTLEAAEEHGRLRVDLTYSTDLFRDTRMRRLLDQYFGLLEEFAADPSQRVADLVLAEEIQQESIEVPKDDPAPALADGGPLRISPGAPRVLTGYLERAASGARHDPVEGDMVFIHEDGTVRARSYADLLIEARRIAGGLRAAGLGPGDKVLLQLDLPAEMISAFWGCLVGGFVPVPAQAPPRYDDSSMARLEQLWTVLNRAAVICNDRSEDGLRAWADAGKRLLPLSRLARHDPPDPVRPAAPEDLALLMPTSGSTGAPKLVSLSHWNLVARSLASIEHNRFSREEVSLNWMPLTHVAGLVYFHLRDVCLGCRQVHVATDVVLAEPIRWIEALDRFRATVTFAPNFAFGLINDQAGKLGGRRWDLSALHWVLNGAEPIVERTARRFLELLGPHGLSPSAMVPAWGMSETSSGVTYGNRFATCINDPRGVDLGRPIPGVRLRIVDDQGQVLPEGVEGRLQAQGAPVAVGYFGEPKHDSFTPDGWLDTGDVGVLREGRLTLTGRAKEVLIVRGANFSAGQIEALVEEVPGVEVSFTAACVLPDPGNSADRLAVFFCPREGHAAPELTAAIRGKLTRALGLAPHWLISLKKTDVPKTPLGKIQRSVLRDRLRAGEFDEPTPREPLPRWFFQWHWKSMPISAAASTNGQSWLVFADTAGVGASLAARHDGPTILVRAGTAFQQLGEREFIIDPARHEDYRRLLSVLEDVGARPDAVIHLWTCDPGWPAAQAGEETSEGVDQVSVVRGLHSVVRLVQAWSIAFEKCRLVVVSGRPSSASDGSASMLRGWLGCLAQELPSFQCRHLCLNSTAPSQSAEWVHAELSAADAEPEVAWDTQGRQVPRLVQMAMEGPEIERLRPGGLYLVTGGLGGVGRELAAQLLEEYHARLLLIGRRELDAESRDALETLEQRGGAVRYRAVDAGDFTALERAVREVEALWNGKVEGVFHLAGIAGPRPVAEETPATLAEAFRAKVDGTLNLDRLLHDRSDAFLVCWSSMNAWFGGPTYGAYAAANRFLETFTEQRNGRGHANTYCLGWSMWAGLGMNRQYAQHDQSREAGFAALSSREGLRSLFTVLRRPAGSWLIGLDAASSLVQRHAAAAAREGAPGPRSNPKHNPKRTGVAPRTETERRLVELWEEVLGVAGIAVQDNFFELGGHSLLATQLVSRIRQRWGCDLRLSVLFESPTVEGLAQCLPSETTLPPPNPNLAPMRPIARQGRFPMSFAQERLWFFDRLLPGSAFYNIPTAYRLIGPLDVPGLRRAFEELARRHETLRTTFNVFEATPMQVVNPPAAWELQVEDLSQEADREEALRRQVGEEAEQPFDLAVGPLMRVRLLRLDRDEHVLLVTMHHIISDGWSMAVFLRELSALYQAPGDPLPNLAVQYADFAQWQRERMRGPALEELLNYWREDLAGAPHALELPGDHPRPALPSFRGRSERFVLTSEVIGRLRELSREQGVTLFMTLLAGFQTLLHRYTGHDDFLIGTPIANRNRVETERLIGFLANTLVLRGDLSGDPSFLELLRRTQARSLEAYAHQDLPFEKLVEALNPERDLSRQPLFQVMFVLQNAPTHELRLKDLRVSSVEVDLGMALFDLTLYLEETSDGLKGTFEYNSDLFEPETIRRLAEHFQVLMEVVGLRPELTLSEVPLLRGEERALVVQQWNATARPYPRQRCIHQLFEEQAVKSPDAVALEWGSETITYDALNAQANRLARWLQRQGAGPEKLVGVFMDRSPTLIVTLLAILKAGGGYLPLATEYPSERLRFMLNNAGALLLLTEPTLARKLPELPVPVLCLDGVESRMESAANLQVDVEPTGLAYVMYTSGSTGHPKGVAIVHRGVVRLVKNTEYARFDEVFLQLAPVSFDASTFEIWGPLLNGARLVLMPSGTPSLAELGAVVRDRGVTTLWLTADLFELMVETRLEDLRGLRQLLAGGDVLSPSHVNRALAALPELTLINGYGPTETTTFAACYPMRGPREDSRPVPIGRPIANTRIYLLDRSAQPVPVGVPGELYIGGDGLARGYVNAPQLTTSRFVADPFSSDPQDRLYRTGDFGRYRPDGTIEFLGRRDHQVKIRGFRVELQEVEAALEAHPAIGRAVAVARQDMPGGKSLVGYFTCRQRLAPDARQLRQFLKERLPDYMVPSSFVLLNDLPLNPSGKLDRDALPCPAPELSASNESDAPRDLLEVQLTQLWEQALGRRPIGVHDNFFDLGGHSLLAVRLFSEVERVTGKRLPLATLFQTPTVHELAAVLRHEGWTPPWSSLVAIKPGGTRTPFFIIHGVGGNVLNFHGLARYLGEDQPVYGLQSQGLDGRAAPPRRIEDMAAHYLKEIRSVQPSGPYLLGGMSFGGVVAFEMAQQLLASGEEVGLLALLDSLPLGCSELTPITRRPRQELGFLWRRVRGHWQAWRAQPAGERWLYLSRKARTLHRRVRSHLWQATYRFWQRTGLELLDSFQNVKETNFLAAKEYVTKVYPGKVTLFIAAEQSLGEQFDPLQLWSNLAQGGIVIHQIPGNHVTLIEEPHVQVLADRLRESLDRCLTTAR